MYKNLRGVNYRNSCVLTVVNFVVVEKVFFA